MRKILVVNSHIDTMELLKGWLETKQYEVKYTGDPQEAMKLVKNFAPDLVLIDILRQDVAEMIKKDESFKSVPVILMTGYTKREKLPDVELEDVIEKPFSPAVLEKKIEKIFLEKKKTA